MCWNENVSLNTFLFSSFILLLIFYNNTYTQYKVYDFNSIWVYLFFISFISMQLIEFFIWRNINDQFYNFIFSTMALILIFIQPIITLMWLPVKYLRNKLIVSYLLFFVPYFIYKFINNNVRTKISSKGHLVWLFFDTNILLFILWLFFFLFSFFYRQINRFFIYGLILFCISCFNFYNDKTIGSMWCWLVNSSMIFYAIYLLLYLPFYEKELC